MAEHHLAPTRSANLLNRILDQPELVALVQRLEPDVLTRLIRHIGLEDAAEIVSMATVAQLHRVFDEDLWYSDTPGADESFNAARFILWLEVLQENGSGYAAEKIRQFDEDLLTLALSRHLLVLDREALVARMNLELDPDQADLMDKALDSSLCQEFDQFVVVGRTHNAWEPIMALLVELNEIDYPLFSRVLERCAAHSADYIEDNGGLMDVLTSGEMLAEDVAGDREGRRQESGYVIPSAARTFLNVARTRTMAENAAAKTWDHDTQRYFRHLQALPAKAATVVDNPSTPAPDPAARRRFTALLKEAQILDSAQDVIQIEMNASDGAASGRQILISQAMQALREKAPGSYDQRLSEISYLANVLIAGCPYLDRRFRPVEAAEAALATCQLGAEFVLQRRLDRPQKALFDAVVMLLVDNDLVRMFNTGWRALHQQVVMTAAETLSALIRQAKNGTSEKQHPYELAALSDALEKKITVSQPWLFLSEIDDLLGYLDNDLLSSLIDVLREYPTLPAEMAIKEGGTRLPLIYSQGQIQCIETWLADLNKKGAAGPSSRER